MRETEAAERRVVRLVTDPALPDWLGYRYLGDWRAGSGQDLRDFEIWHHDLLPVT